MWLSIAGMVGGLLVLGAGIRGLAWLRRTRARRWVEAADVVLEAHAISARVLCQGRPLLPSMRSDRANRTIVDLIRTDEKLLISSSRGPLLFLEVGGEQKITSARAPGPGRLVVEGNVPPQKNVESVSSTHVGSYRLEFVVPDAQAWVAALEPFVSDDNGGFSVGQTAADG